MILSPEAQILMATADNLVIHHSLVLRARSRTDDVQHTVALWTGDDDERMEYTGEVIDHFGQSLMPPDTISYGVGVTSVQQDLSVPTDHPGVRTAMRTYTLKMAYARWFMLLCSGRQIIPVRMFFGQVVDATEDYPNSDEGEAPITTLTLESGYDMTRGIVSRKSDSTQRARNPKDTILQYSTIGGRVPIRQGYET